MNKPTTLIFLAALTAYALPVFSSASASASATASATPTAPVFGANANAHAHASASAAASEPRSKEFDEKRGASAELTEPIDVELDTAAAKARLTPPSDVELKAAYVEAERATTQLAMLLALSKPYAQKDPDRFAFEVFERWKKLCEIKGFTEEQNRSWFARAAEKAGIFSQPQCLIFKIDDFTVEVNALFKAAVDRAPLNPVAACCMCMLAAFRKGNYGLIDPMSGLNYDAGRGEWEVAGFMNLLLNHREIKKMGCVVPYTKARYEVMQRSYGAHAYDQARQKQYARAICHGTGCLVYDVASVIVSYLHHYGLSIDDVRDIALEGRAAAAFQSVHALLTDLSGLERISQPSVWLDHNSISILRSHFNWPTTLRSLNLTNNRIATVEPLAFAHGNTIESLELAYNKLKVINRMTFVGLTRLQTLNLNYNAIEHIDDEALLPLASLTLLTLDGNNLQKFPRAVRLLAEQGRLTSLFIAGNPFRDKPEEIGEYQAVQRIIEKNIESLVVIRPRKSYSPKFWKNRP